MDIAALGLTYHWIDGWGHLPDTPSAMQNGRTHGVAVLTDGRVVVFRQADPAVVVLGPDGTCLDAWGSRFAGAHGLTAVDERGQPRLWVTDEVSGEVSKLTLDGDTLLTLEPPVHPAYAAGRYAPTWVAVDERRHGGSGDVWVADGYGASLVHRYTERGHYVGSLDGTDGAGAFNCPHAVWIDRRRGEPELYVADRGHRRLQVFGLDGCFRRTAGDSVLDCPCTGVVVGDHLVVPELSGRLTVLDAGDGFVGHVGFNDGVCALPGWPDVSADHLREGRFNSPHAAAVDADGSLYVVEWILGGRVTKLARC